MTEFAAAPPGRRVILILSDGKDGGPQVGEPFVSSLEVTDRAQHEDVIIYGVGVRSAPGPVAPNDVLSLADRLASPLLHPSFGAVALVGDLVPGFVEQFERPDQLNQPMGRGALTNGVLNPTGRRVPAGDRGLS